MSSENETKFNQSEAVTRCRGFKEAKLKGQYALAKLVDEEVTIHSANLDEGRNQLMTQLFEQRSFDKRQEAEAEDFKTGRERKNQFVSLVDKLSALKLTLRFQEDNRETETAFKLSIRHKRAAFQVQLARLEKRQIAERNELMAAQTRLTHTAARIRAIDVGNMKDLKAARILKKKHAVMDQQAQMKQQKESQFLREIQLCKTRQLQQLTELDITNSEELQELIYNQKAEEFDLIAKHKIIESQNEAALDKQMAEVQSTHLIERQKIIKIQLQRAQKKQQHELEKAQKSAARLREKVMLAENPVILNSSTSGMRRGDNTSDDQSDTSRSQSVSMSQSGASQFEEAEMEAEATEEEGSEGAEVVKKNSDMNKSKADHHIVTDEERELAAMLEVGRERNQNIANHHKNIIKELKSQHKAQLNLKIRDQKRKVADLLKEQQEEMETLKNEQEQTMSELLSTQVDVEDTSADASTDSGLIKELMPDHIRADIAIGNTPEPAKFQSCPMACIEICRFNDICATAGPEGSFAFIKSAEDMIDQTLAKFPGLFKVKFEKGICIVAAGLSKENMIGDAHVAVCANGLCEFVQTIQNTMSNVRCPGSTESTYVETKAGVHVGPCTGGLIGTTYASYHLMGTSINVCKQMCATSEANCVQVSSMCKDGLGEESDFAFEERGNVEIEGFGKLTTFWMKSE